MGAPICDTWNDVTRPTVELSTPSPTTPACIEDNECEMSDAICNNDYSNCKGDMVCNGQHLCKQPGLPIVMDIIVKTKSCSGCAAGNTEQGLQVQLSGLLGLTECTTDNLDNPDAHDYGSGSVAHFGADSGSIAWTGAGTWTPESQDTICVDFYGDDNQNYCCQLGQALTSADGFKPLSNCNPV